MRKLRKSNQGFTIIEVLIVLAIAGLILLIVFLAVPALQRNSRNNGRKNDAARIGAEVNDYVSNNNGTFPPNGLAFVGVVLNAGNLAQYDANQDLMYATGNQGAIGNGQPRPRVRLVVSARCNGSSTSSASSRQGALQYQLETPTANNYTDVCLDI